MSCYFENKAFKELHDQLSVLVGYEFPKAQISFALDAMQEQGIWNPDMEWPSAITILSFMPADDTKPQLKLSNWAEFQTWRDYSQPITFKSQQELLDSNQYKALKALFGDTIDQFVNESTHTLDVSNAVSSNLEIQNRISCDAYNNNQTMSSPFAAAVRVRNFLAGSLVQQLSNSQKELIMQNIADILLYRKDGVLHIKMTKMDGTAIEINSKETKKIDLETNSVSELTTEDKQMIPKLFQQMLINPDFTENFKAITILADHCITLEDKRALAEMDIFGNAGLYTASTYQDTARLNKVLETLKESIKRQISENNTEADVTEVNDWTDLVSMYENMLDQEQRKNLQETQDANRQKLMEQRIKDIANFKASCFEKTDDGDTRLSLTGKKILSGLLNRGLTQKHVDANIGTTFDTTQALICTNGDGDQILQTVSIDYESNQAFKTVVNLATGETTVYRCTTAGDEEMTEDFVNALENQNYEVAQHFRKIYNDLKNSAGLKSATPSDKHHYNNVLDILPDNIDKSDLAQVKKYFYDLYRIVDVTTDIPEARWGQLYNLYMRSLLEDPELEHVDFTADTSYNKNFDSAYFDSAVQFVDHIEDPDNDVNLLHIYAVTDNGQDVRVELDLNAENPIAVLQILDENNEFQNMDLSQQLLFKFLNPELYESLRSLGMKSDVNFDPYTTICSAPNTVDQILQSRGYMDNKEGLETYKKSIAQRNKKPLQISDTSMFIENIPAINRLLDMNRVLPKKLELNGRLYSTIGEALKHYALSTYANAQLYFDHTEQEVQEMFDKWMQDDCTISELLEQDESITYGLLPVYINDAMQAIFPKVLENDPELVEAIRNVNDTLVFKNSDTPLNKILLNLVNQKIKQYKNVLPGHHPITVRVSNPSLFLHQQVSAQLGEYLNEHEFTAIYDMQTYVTPKDFDQDLLELWGLGPNNSYTEEEWKEQFPYLCAEQEMVNNIKNSDVTIITEKVYNDVKEWLEKYDKPYIIFHISHPLDQALSKFNSEDNPVTSVNFIGDFNNLGMEVISKGLQAFTSRQNTPSSVGANQAHLDNMERLQWIPYFNNGETQKYLSVTDIQLLSSNLADMVTMTLNELQEKGTSEGFESTVIGFQADYSKMTHQQILASITPNKFVQLLRQKFVNTIETKTGEASGDPTLHYVSRLADIYFEDLLYRASSDIKKREHFVLSKMKTSKLVKNDNSDYNNDPDAVTEEEGSVLEHWQVESCTVDVSTTVSMETQQFFMMIPELDSTGKPTLSKFGMPNFMSSNSVKHCLNSWLAGIDTLSDMKEVLQEKAKYCPWLQPILDKLNTPDGKNEQFKSEFFVIMNCSRSNYGSLDFQGKGNVFNRIKNENTVLSRIYSIMKAKMVQSKIELFIPGDPKKETAMMDLIQHATNIYTFAKELNDIYKDFIIYERKTGFEANQLLEQKFAEQEYIDKQNAFIDNIFYIYHDLLKMDVTREDCAQITNINDVFQVCKGLQKMIPILIYSMKGIPDIELTEDSAEKFRNGQKYGTDDARLSAEISIFSYEIDGEKNPYYIGTYLKELISPITNVLSNYTDAVTYHNGKTYQRYTIPSFLTYMNEKLQTLDGAMAFRDTYYTDNPLFRNVWWNINPFDTTQNPLSLTNVFSIFRADYFKHKRQLTQQGKEYMHSMSDLDVELGEIIEFLNATGKQEELGMWTPKNSVDSRQIDDRKQCPYPIAWFKIPTMADKPSSEWMALPTWGNNIAFGTMLPHREIVMCQYLDQEISRIKTVKARQTYLHNKLKQSMSEDEYNALTDDQKQKKIKELPEYIASYDTPNPEFVYLKWLNDSAYDNAGIYNIQTHQVDSVDFRKLLNKKINGSLTAEEDSLFRKAFISVTNSYMEMEFQKLLQHLNDTDLYPIIEKYLPYEASQQRLKDFVWSHKINSIAMIQMLHGDLAFYKDDTDGQKRFAQVHSSTKKPNIEACSPTISSSMWKGYQGMKVSDGKHRCILIKDFESASNMTPYMKALYQDLITKTTDPVLKEYYKAELQQRLIEYNNVNQTDGQAFNTPSSIRKKMVMLGQWTEKQEEVYQQFRKWFYYKHIKKDDSQAKNYELTSKQLNEDFVKVLKPFFYGFYDVDSKVGKSSPNSTIRVPFQLKNSEFTMLPIGVMGEDNETTANLMRALFVSMESTYYDDNGDYMPDGIDSVQFASCAKVGCSGVIDLSSFENDKENGEKNAETLLKQCMAGNPTTLRSQVTDNTLVKSRYDNDYVHESPYNCWGDQVQVHSDFKDGEMSETSQARIIIQTDLESTDSDGNPTMYDMGDGTKGTKKEFQEKFNDLYVEKIQMAINNLRHELKLDGSNEREKNEALAQMLIDQAEKSPSRYSLEFIHNLKLWVNDDFRVPLSDPETASTVESLCNSLVRNRVYKDSVEGSPIVQVSCFGKSEALQVRFKNVDGNQLLTRKEFESKHPNDSFEDYVKKNAHSLDCLEVYATMPTSELEQFLDADGKVDMEMLETVAPDMLKAIGIRVPTEQKYSILPLKIVGILPSALGEGMILPQDITMLTGADFDIDKLYTKRMKVSINNKIKDALAFDTIGKQAVEIWEQKLKEARSYQEKNMLRESRFDFLEKTRAELYNKTIKQLIKDFKDSGFGKGFDNDDEIKQALIAINSNIKDLNDLSIDSALKNAIRKFVFYQEDDSKKPRKDQINNQMFKMMMGILQHPQTLPEILTPGGYKKLKLEAYRIAAFKLKLENPKTNKPYTLSELNDVSLDELESKISRNLDITSFLDDAKAYDMNQAAKDLVAISASTRIAHAQLTEVEDAWVDMTGVDSELVGLQILDFKISDKIQIGIERNGIDKEPVSKILARFLTASLDNAKDPCMQLANINPFTCNVAMAMARAGMPEQLVLQLMSTNPMLQAVQQCKQKKVEGNASLATVIKTRMDAIEKLIGKEQCIKASLTEGDLELLLDKTMSWKQKAKDDDDEDNLTADELRYMQVEYKLLSFIKGFKLVGDQFMMVDSVTKFNSAKNAPGPTVIGNKLMLEQLQSFAREKDNYHIVHGDDSRYDLVPDETSENQSILEQCPISEAFLESYQVAMEMNRHSSANNTRMNKIIRMFANMPFAITHIKNTHNLDKQLNNFFMTWEYMSYMAQKYKMGIDDFYDKLNTSAKELLKNFEEFKSNYKRHYPQDSENALLQILSIDVSSSVDDNAQNVEDFLCISKDFGTNFKKEELMVAWQQLFDNDKKLAQQLLDYCILKGGVTWNKNTWIQYMPNRMKWDMDWTNAFNQFSNKGRGLNDSFNTVTFIDAFIRHNLNDTTFVTNYYPGKTSIYGTEPYMMTTPRNMGGRKVMTLNLKHYSNKKINATFTPYLRFENKVYRFQSYNSILGTMDYEEVSDLSKNGTTVTAFNDNPPSEDFQARFERNSWRMTDGFSDMNETLEAYKRAIIAQRPRTKPKVANTQEEREQRLNKKIEEAKPLIDSVNDEEYLQNKSDIVTIMDDAETKQEPLSDHDVRRIVASVFKFNDPIEKESNMQKFFDISTEERLGKYQINLALNAITGTATDKDVEIVQLIWNNLKCFNN